MRTRHGFTIFELLMVMVIGSIMLAVVAPGVSHALAKTRVQRAAAVVAGDLQLAHSLAARQRAPVTVSVNTHARTIVVHRETSPFTVFSTTRLDRTSEYPMQLLTSNNTSVTIYPNGLATATNWPLTITLQAAGMTREVRMNRVGQVRVR
jgi:prepilin-type N-terminal cleavage/methylation domain-containing protein